MSVKKLRKQYNIVEENKVQIKEMMISLLIYNENRHL